MISYTCYYSYLGRLSFIIFSQLSHLFDGLVGAGEEEGRPFFFLDSEEKTTYIHKKKTVETWIGCDRRSFSLRINRFIKYYNQ